jgi:transcriptional regulator with XRE-family HTH domain
MRGIDVKKKLLDDGIKLNNVAEAMGIIPQTLHSLLQAEDIKTGVLENIAKAINKSIYFFFEEDGRVGNNIIASGSCRVNTHTNVDNHQYYSDSVEVLQTQLEEKERLLKEKDERLREKDEYMRELRETVKELRETVKELKTIK